MSAKRVGSDRVHVPSLLAENERLRAENERLQAIVKGAWRFWAATVPGAKPTEDRGYRIVRVRADKLAEFDALFSAAVIDNRIGPSFGRPMRKEE